MTISVDNDIQFTPKEAVLTNVVDLDVFKILFKYEMKEIDSDGDIIFNSKNGYGVIVSNFRCLMEHKDINTLRNFESSVVTLEESVHCQYSRYLLVNNKNQMAFVAYPNKCHNFRKITDEDIK